MTSQKNAVRGDVTMTTFLKALVRAVLYDKHHVTLQEMQNLFYDVGYKRKNKMKSEL